MGKTSEIAIGVPSEMVVLLDESLKLDNIKQMGITSRRQLVIMILRKWIFEQPPTGFELNEKDNDERVKKYREKILSNPMLDKIIMEKINNILFEEIADEIISKKVIKFLDDTKILKDKKKD